MANSSQKRTHDLINLGGLVRIAGLDKLNPALLLGLLIRARGYLDKLPESELVRLKNTGIAILQQRKEKGPKRTYEC